MTEATAANDCVLLVNMPFASASFPSLALGLFKSRLEADGVDCDVAYLNLRFAQMVGWEKYVVVERCTAALAGEQMFAHVLFGDAIPPEYYYQANVLADLPAADRDCILDVKRHVEPFLVDCLASIEWSRYRIVGFSSLFEQNVPSLALACQIKRLYPDTVIIFGGANCEDVMGRTLHECFSFVDYVVNGEGDDVFPELVRRVCAGEPVDDLPGLVHRVGGRSVANRRPSQSVALDTLPVPNYDDYFAGLKSLGAPAWLRPESLVETSRGCWWGAKLMCTFCGLNGENINFRSKSADRALAEIQQLASRYESRVIRAVDNIIPQSYFDELLPALAELDLGIELFYEVRPTLTKEQVAALVDAKVTNVQAGIESLTSSILRLMHKGTTSLRNIEFLRWCRKLGVFVDWNMLFGFPGETPDDYRDACSIIDLVCHLQPPSSVGLIRMDRFSVNFENAHEVGFTNVRPWSVYRYVYPFDEEVLMNLVYFFDCDYQVPIDDGGYLDRIRARVGGWQRASPTLEAAHEEGKLVIRDTRPIATAAKLTIDGVRADVYECCDRHRTVSQVKQWLLDERGINADVDSLERILNQFATRHLMVKEKGYYLSLALMDVGPDVVVRTPLPRIPVLREPARSADAPLAGISSSGHS